MATIRIELNKAGLLNYVNRGKIAVGDVNKAMRVVMNAGRTAVRRLIADQFRSRTGQMKAQARKMNISTTVTPGQIKGTISPLPRLLNIFESGASIPARNNVPKNRKAIRFFSQGEPVFYAATQIGAFHLQPRPVIAPASKTIEDVANRELDKVMGTIAHV